LKNGVNNIRRRPATHAEGNAAHERSAKEGQLSERANPGQFKGSYAEIV